tara:strand:+ start:54203 stop:56587 length:2385 start_codon:yes stop_codon:yes gene_type:complete
MSIKGKITTLALLSTTALCTISTSAIAQQTDEAASVFDVITVTATRRDANVQDIPYNISATSGAEIENNQTIDASELIRSLPGIAFSDRGPRNAAAFNSFRIRGLNVDGSAAGDVPASSAPTVATYINDTPIFANMLLKDMERVEVLRGPQGTLYGSGALGGAVRFITQKPQLGEFGGYVNGTTSLTKGSGGVNWSGDAVVNVPLGDTFAMRAVVSRTDNAGIIDYVNVYDLDAGGAPVVPGDILDTDASFSTVEDADTVEVDFLRLSALWQMTENVDINLMYSLQRDNIGSRRATAEGFSNGSGGTYGEYQSGSVQLEPAESDVDLFAAEVTIDMGFATLTSSSSYYDVDGYAISENTGFYAQKNWLGGLYYNAPRPLARADRSYANSAFVQELRLVSDSDGPVNWIVGGYYQDEDRNVGQTSTLAGYGAWMDAANPWSSDGFGQDDNDNDFIFRDKASVKEKALYGELTWDVTDSLNVTGGLRWFDSKVGSDAEVQLPFWDSLASWAPAVTVTESGKKDVLFKLNASLDVGDDSMIYGTISEGYRRGGASAVPTQGNFAEDPAWLSYGSDAVTNYEIGFKGETHNMRYTASVFLVDWKDPQINTSTTNWGFFTVANGDKAKTKGVELELQGRLTDEIGYALGYAYVDAKLTADFNNSTGALIAANGNTLPGVPEHMLNVSVDYTKYISENTEMTLRLGGYVQSSTQNYINNDHATYGHQHKGFSIWNASATLRWDETSLTIFAKNLFNSDGSTALFSEAWMGTSPAQNYLGSGAKREITLPRTIGAAIRHDF